MQQPDHFLLVNPAAQGGLFTPGSETMTVLGTQHEQVEFYQPYMINTEGQMCDACKHLSVHWCQVRQSRRCSEKGAGVFLSQLEISPIRSKTDSLSA